MLALVRTPGMDLAKKFERFTVTWILHTPLVTIFSERNGRSVLSRDTPEIIEDAFSLVDLATFYTAITKANVGWRITTLGSHQRLVMEIQPIGSSCAVPIMARTRSSTAQTSQFTTEGELLATAD